VIDVRNDGDITDLIHFGRRSSEGKERGI